MILKIDRKFLVQKLHSRWFPSLFCLNWIGTLFCTTNRELVKNVPVKTHPILDLVVSMLTDSKFWNAHIFTRPTTWVFLCLKSLFNSLECEVLCLWYLRETVPEKFFLSNLYLRTVVPKFLFSGVLTCRLFLTLKISLLFEKNRMYICLDEILFNFKATSDLALLGEVVDKLRIYWRMSATLCLFWMWFEPWKSKMP